MSVRALSHRPTHECVVTAAVLPGELPGALYNAGMTAGDSTRKRVRQLWDRALPEVIAGVVAGLVLLIVPPVISAVAGVTLEINPLYIAAAFVAGALAFGLYRLMRWARDIARRFHDLE